MQNLGRNKEALISLRRLLMLIAFVNVSPSLECYTMTAGEINLTEMSPLLRLITGVSCCCQLF